MTDLECQQIVSKAVTHLICCAFDDMNLATLDTINALKELKWEFIE